MKVRGAVIHQCRDQSESPNKHRTQAKRFVVESVCALDINSEMSAMACFCDN
jgi:hypothetical protein